MCGIFGLLSSSPLESRLVSSFVKSVQRRGQDSSGLVVFENNAYNIHRADSSIVELAKNTSLKKSSFLMGHGRLITNSTSTNQPVWSYGACVLHNGIITNTQEIWKNIGLKPHTELDTEVVPALISTLGLNPSLSDVEKLLNSQIRGSASLAILFPSLGRLILYTNTGSLYYSIHADGFMFNSEEYPLRAVASHEVKQVSKAVELNVPCSDSLYISEKNTRTIDFVPPLIVNNDQKRQLIYRQNSLRRCSKCILPETMPFIAFDSNGVCNYCNNYKSTKKSTNPDAFLDAIGKSISDSPSKKCIVPFSGGRDSSYVLHLLRNELNITPITMTYDWGMVTDLARRNISRMSSQLGVENIIFSDNISKKRSYISKNLRAWLKKPHLGMLNILMAGDKHFFRHIETLKKETKISTNIWGMNPLEVTHFKAGFLGFPPRFNTSQVFYVGKINQLYYHSLRIKQYIKNPAYLNSSIFDTYLGEYYRSIHKKTGFFNLFDYFQWDEDIVNSALEVYGWEKSPDTKSTWRIGDGTAAFYNYIYYNVAGFTENDTFRSNQIREGLITRSQALTLVQDENAPRYSNIRWYLDTLGFDFSSTIQKINSIPPMFAG